MGLVDELNRIQAEMEKAQTEKELAAQKLELTALRDKNPATGIIFQQNNNQVVELPGGKVRTLRKGLELTQKQLAEKAGLTAATVRAVEREQRLVRVKTAVKIAKALELKTPMRLHPGLPLFFVGEFGAGEPGVDERGLVAGSRPEEMAGHPLGLDDPKKFIVTRANGNRVVELPGRKVELLRRRARLSREELAEKAGVTEKTVEMIECERRLVTVGTALRIAKALDVIPSKLHPTLPIFW